MPEKRKRRNPGPRILHWLRERGPMQFEELIWLHRRWRYGVLKPRKERTAWQKSAQAIKMSVTRLALNGLVRVTADVPPFGGLKVLLTDKGRDRIRGSKNRGEEGC